MLDTAYDFNANMALTNGSTVTADARAMLTAWNGSTSTNQTGPVSIWTPGSIAQTIIIADHQNSATCNSHACSTYDLGPGPNASDKSVRPIFHATFWPGSHRVRVRFIGENCNTEAWQNQSYSLALTTGNASPASVYTKTTFTHFSGARWTKGGDAIGEYWIGGAPGAIAIDHNIAYITSHQLVMPYDPAISMSSGAISTAFSGWTSSAKDIGDLGQMSANINDGGSHMEIGPYPTVVSWWLYDMANLTNHMRDAALGNSDLAGWFPTHIREGKAGNRINRTDTGGSGTGLGHILSITDRPTFWSEPAYDDPTWINLADRITIRGTSTGGWPTPDGGHTFDFHTLPYLLTGDYWQLEEAWFAASYDTTKGKGIGTADPDGRGPTGAEGGFENNGVRYEYFPAGFRATASQITPTGLPERTYFDVLTNDFLALEEGAHGITGTAFSVIGNFYKPVYDWAVSFAAARNRYSTTYDASGALSPIHQFQVGNTGLGGEGEIDNTVCNFGTSPFEQTEAVISVQRIQDLGYTQSAALNAWMAVLINNYFSGSNFSRYYATYYRAPTIKRIGNTWVQNGAEYKACLQSVYQNPTSWSNASSPVYVWLLNAASALMAVEPIGGASVWATVNTEIHNSFATSQWATDPQYALSARNTTAVSPTIITTTLPTGTVGVAYSQSIAATGTTPITITSTGGLPGWATLDATGLVHGTPNTSATSTIAAVATNTAGSDSKNVSLTINPAPSIAARTSSGKVSFSGTVR
jgi:hypothetical protein